MSQAAMDLIDRARGLTTFLERGKACCPMCLSEVTDGFSSDEVALDEARRRLHAFWNACMGAVISSYLDPDFIVRRWGQQRRNLRVAVEACTLHTRPAGDDMVHEFLRAACACLHLALSSGASSGVHRAAHSKRALENKAGLWPKNLRQLFAYDARNGTSCTAFWTVHLGTAEPLHLLADMVLIAHPLVCSEIVQNSPLHRGLIKTVTGHIFSYASWKIEGPARWGDVSVARAQLLTENMAAAVRLLNSILTGPDALPEAFVAIADGFEPLLWSSLESALSTIDTQHPIYESVEALIISLSYLIPPPPPDMLMIPGIMECFMPPAALTFAGVVFDTYHMLRNARRFCHRCWRPALTPDLTTPGPGGGDTHFCVCNRCQLSRYCSSECQRADWRNGEPVRHRAVCPLLARIRAADETKTDSERLQDDIAALEFSREEKITLSLFALNPKVVFIPMLVRCAEIHRELLGNDEYPPASVKALARVDVLKSERDNKLARIDTRLQARFGRDNRAPSRE